jgi:hypothetical protein
MALINEKKLNTRLVWKFFIHKTMWKH